MSTLLLGLKQISQALAPDCATFRWCHSFGNDMVGSRDDYRWREAASKAKLQSRTSTVGRMVPTQYFQDALCSSGTQAPRDKVMPRSQNRKAVVHQDQDCGLSGLKLWLDVVAGVAAVVSHIQLIVIGFGEKTR